MEGGRLGRRGKGIIDRDSTPRSQGVYGGARTKTVQLWHTGARPGERRNFKRPAPKIAAAGQGRPNELRSGEVHGGHLGQKNQKRMRATVTVTGPRQLGDSGRVALSM